jgi:hypothetical protein
MENLTEFDHEPTGIVITLAEKRPLFIHLKEKSI